MWLPPIESASPSPVASQTDSSGRAILIPVAIEVSNGDAIRQGVHAFDGTGHEAAMPIPEAELQIAGGHSEGRHDLERQIEPAIPIDVAESDGRRHAPEIGAGPEGEATTSLAEKRHDVAAIPSLPGGDNEIGDSVAIEIPALDRRRPAFHRLKCTRFEGATTDVAEQPHGALPIRRPLNGDEIGAPVGIHVGGEHRVHGSTRIQRCWKVFSASASRPATSWACPRFSQALTLVTVPA